MMNLETQEIGKFTADTVEKLKGSQYGVLASISGMHPRSRTVDYVNIDLEIGLFTWDHTEKIKEIAQNPNVSFCVGGVWIEGTASVKSIQDESISHLKSEYSRKLPELYAKFMRLPGVVFLTITPAKVNRMVLDQGALYNITLNVESGLCVKEKLSDWQ